MELNTPVPLALLDAEIVLRLGVAALLGMLNSCGSGVTVVNIDNGFGAAYAASQINALVANSK